jgi:hypothetical protein
MEAGHRLTVLNRQTKLRHPQACDGVDCAVEAAVKLSDSVAYFRNGLYSVAVNSCGKVHLKELHPVRSKLHFAARMEGNKLVSVSFVSRP